ncbi:MAG: PseG/SpsG family protein [Nitrospinales bacterium]
MKIGIRVDGSFHIGLGHIYKSLWLAEALRKKGCEVTFLTTEDPAAVDLIRRKNFPLHLFAEKEGEDEKVAGINRWVEAHSPAVFVIDHWDWSQAYWTSLENKPGALFVGMDVPPEGYGKFDLAFQGIRNLAKNSEVAEKGCNIFEGPAYLMICPEFERYSRAWKPPPRLKNILLTFGSTDVGNFSLKTLAWFEQFPHEYNLTLILGPGSHPILDSVNQYLRKSRLKVALLQDVPCLPAYMRSADLVLSTAGMGTLSELALTGAPAIVFAAVPHQADNAKRLSHIGGILNCAGEVGIIDARCRDYIKELTDRPLGLKTLSDKWRGLVDAEGINRIVDIIIQHAGSK